MLFAFIPMSCNVRSTLVRCGPPPSAAIVTELVTRLRARWPFLFVLNCRHGPARGYTAQVTAYVAVRLDGYSPRGLLYLASVRDDGRGQECRQGRVDTGSVSLMVPERWGSHLLSNCPVQRGLACVCVACRQLTTRKRRKEYARHPVVPNAELPCTAYAASRSG
jgi:hypothetical protein